VLEGKAVYYRAPVPLSNHFSLLSLDLYVQNLQNSRALNLSTEILNSSFLFVFDENSSLNCGVFQKSDF